MKSRWLGLMACGLSWMLVGLIMGAPFASAELMPVESRLAEIARQQKGACDSAARTGGQHQ